MPSSDNPLDRAAPHRVVRERSPLNLEFPFDSLNSFLTPTELFYIRSHFPVPHLDESSYRLSIEGAVKHPFSLSYAEIEELAKAQQTATLECGGNSRVFLVPKVEGAQWGPGAVSNAVWTGVPLHLLLERAGLAEDACEIVLEGADCGMPAEKPLPPHAIHYARSLRLEKALQPEVLIATQMNGKPLPADHGFPVRAIVPGHYGMASVKWLTRIHAVREPFAGYWQTSDYAYWDDCDGNPVRRPLGEMQVKSAIARPGIYETLDAGSPYLIYGAAWTGEADASEIEISTDGGHSWRQGEFIDPVQRYAWRRWQYLWQTPSEPVDCTLMSRARDTTGAFQPEGHSKRFGTYVIRHTVPIEVFVR